MHNQKNSLRNEVMRALTFSQEQRRPGLLAYVRLRYRQSRTFKPKNEKCYASYYGGNYLGQNTAT